jgi:preprotein translocase subunit YajC
MNILSFYFISILMMSGLMIILYRSRKTFQKAHVELTEKSRNKADRKRR